MVFFYFCGETRASSKIARKSIKARWFIKQSKMSEIASVLKLSTEYITSGMDTQKPWNRQYVPGQCSGKWSDEEHMKYIAFLDVNKEVMKSKEKRRSNNFYREMADFIQTRNPLQCRSHHQKLEAKYIHPIKIVSYFRQQFDTDTYKEIKQGLILSKKTKFIGRQKKIPVSESVQAKIKIETQIGHHLTSIDSRTHNQQPYFPFQQSLPFIQMASYPSPNSIYMSIPYSWAQPVFAYGFEFN